tara:strand:+ start:249 stop:689 length:441 start_codon:yes stop_codon:yes gene_type:complete
LEALGVVDPASILTRPVVAPVVVGTVEMVRYPVAEMGLHAEAVNITGTGFFGITVPANEDWLVHLFTFGRDAGTYTSEYARLIDPDGTVIRFEDYAATNAHVKLFADALPLPHGWQIGAHFNVHSGAGNCTFRAFYTRYRRVTVPV